MCHIFFFVGILINCPIITIVLLCTFYHLHSNNCLLRLKFDWLTSTNFFTLFSDLYQHILVHKTISQKTTCYTANMYCSFFFSFSQLISLASAQECGSDVHILSHSIDALKCQVNLYSYMQCSSTNIFYPRTPTLPRQMWHNAYNWHWNSTSKLVATVIMQKKVMKNV